MYKIEYNRIAQRQLRRVHSDKVKLIAKKLEMVAKNPYAKINNVTKLQGRDGYRLRVGDYRISYTINDDILVIEVIEVMPRGGAYK